MIGTGFHRPWVEGYASIARHLAISLGDVAAVSMLGLMRHDYGGTWPNLVGERTDIELVDSFFLRKLRAGFAHGLIQDAALANRIRRAFRKKDAYSHFDIVHLFNVSHMMNSILLGQLPTKKKIVVHVCGPGNFGYVLSKNTVDAYICTTRSAQKYLLGHGVSSDKVFFVPPIISPTLFGDAANSRKKNKSGSAPQPNRLTITYMGNLNSWRFPPALIDEFELLPNTGPKLRFQIYCPERERDKNNVKELKTRAGKSKNEWSINFGNLNERSKIRVYKSSDIVIFPFAHDQGPIVNPPLTLLESMACGTVVVASQTSGIEEVITDGYDGYLVQAGNLPTLVDKVFKLCHNHESLRWIKGNAQETILDRYSPYNLSREVLNIYQNVLN